MKQELLYKEQGFETLQQWVNENSRNWLNSVTGFLFFGMELNLFYLRELL